MSRKITKTIALGTFALVVVLGTWWQAPAQDAKGPYPSMAPLDQYLMADRTAEIALSRSAAPESISRDAEVMVLGRHGYETAVKGKNGFVCMVRTIVDRRNRRSGLLESQATGCRSASTRRPRDPTFHSRSRRPSGYWLDDPKLKCSKVSKTLSTRRNCRRWNLARCAT